MARTSTSILLAVTAVQRADACSTFMVNPNVAKEAASARTFDYDSYDLNSTIDIVPRGSTLWSGLMNQDVTGSTRDVNENGRLDVPKSNDTRVYYQNKYSFAVSHQHIYETIVKRTIGDNVTTEYFGDMLFSSVADGLNEKVLELVKELVFLEVCTDWTS
jgi:hypothetical protein